MILIILRDRNGKLLNSSSCAKATLLFYVFNTMNESAAHARRSRPGTIFDKNPPHYGDVIMGAIASQITSLTIVYSTVYSDADQRKHQSSASLAFARVIHRGPVNSPRKWPVTRTMFPFDDVIMKTSSNFACDEFVILKVFRLFTRATMFLEKNAHDVTWL